ncbi:MAG: beta-ketoacyl-[acyl-carrier-protein] synthase family protein [Polyangiaceae bacterium]|nr:beta-ketoacyl-[acyl-carrier-protein] synthase family protein [Polyangiaceae bacterium]
MSALPNSLRRVAVTGLGVVTPIGVGRDRFWASLVEGRSCVVDVGERLGLQTRMTRGCLVTDAAFNEAAAAAFREGGTGRGGSLAAEAAAEALRDAGIDVSALPPRRVGVALGTTLGESPEIEALAAERVGPREPVGERARRFRAADPEAICGVVAQRHGIRGPTLLIPTACAASNYAIGYAFSAIRAGQADVMIAGGAEPFSKVLHVGFSRMKLVASARCQPFDRNRQGLLVSEGAGVLVLEDLERARRRGAGVYGEIVGFGTSCDAYHVTAPEPDGVGAALAMERSLRQAGVAPEAIDYISTHGTGTPANDLAETRAIKRVFGAAAARVPMSSIKSMIGHTMGAAGGIEAVACALVLKHRIIPPTVHHETPDPECDLDCVPNHARRAAVRTLVSNSYGFLGHNASITMTCV